MRYWVMSMNTNVKIILVLITLNKFITKRFHLEVISRFQTK